MVFSSFVFSRLADAFGRKTILLTIAVPHITSLLMIAFAKSIHVLYVSRLFAGIADGIMFTVIPSYIGEIASPKVRGSWGNAFTLFIYLGQFFVNVTGGYTTIKTNAWILLSVPVLFLLTFPFSRETPYFLIMKGKTEEAREVLRYLRGVSDVDQEMSQLEEDVQRQMSESGTWKDLITIDSNRKGLAAGIFLRFAQQFCGIGCFAVYTQYIFSLAGGSLSAVDSSILFSGVCMVLNFCSSLFLDRIGRRLAMISSLLATGIVLLGESAFMYVSLERTDIDVSNFKWVSLLGMLLFLVVYSIGLGIVPTLMLGELFSASIKAKGLCVLNVFFSTYVSGLSKLFQWLATNYGLYLPFAFFGLCTLCNTFLAFYFVPETKGKTLEEIQQSLKSNDRKQNGVIR